jgi:hypothetical protein
VSITASVIDNFAVDRIKEVHACVGSDGEYFYGHSYAFQSALSCFSTYNFDNYDCYCVTHYNSSITDVVTERGGTTCVNLNGPLLHGRDSTQGCSAVFSIWLPNLTAAAYFDIFSCFFILIVSLLSSVLLCCPSALGRLSGGKLKRFEGFEEMNIE